MCDNTKHVHLIEVMIISAMGSEILRQDVTRRRARRMEFRLTVHTTGDFETSGELILCTRGFCIFRRSSDRSPLYRSGPWRAWFGAASRLGKENDHDAITGNIASLENGICCQRIAQLMLVYCTVQMGYHMFKSTRRPAVAAG
jgi:hypothetical protein